MDIIGFVKEHPVPVGIGVVLVIIIISASSKGSAQTSGNNNAAFLQSQKISSDANVQIAAINANVSTAIGGQSVERFKATETAANDRASIMAGLMATLAGTNAQVSVNRDNNMVKNLQIANAHQENTVTAANNYSLTQQTIKANVDAHAQDLAAQERAQTNDNNFKLNYLGASANEQIKMLQTGQATLPALLQHSETMAKISNDGAYQQTLLQTEAARKRATTEADTAKVGAIAGIFKSIGSIFGF